MTELEAIQARHSVRGYQDKPIAPETLKLLRERVQQINQESGLHIQLMEETDGVYGSTISRLSGWRNVPSYLALVGPEGPNLEEKCGYYGEKLVLYAQTIGLNSCWAGIFRAKQVWAEIRPGEKLALTIALGYGATQGKPRKSKTFQEVTELKGEAPDWFKKGVEAALLAPTAVNQQKFRFTLDENGEARLKASAAGPFVNVDLGIVKYHFELASGRTVK